MASSLSFSPSISAVTRSPMMSSVGLDLRLLDLFEEIVFQRRRRLEGTLVLDGVADQLDGTLAEPRQVFLGQAQQLRDDAGRELEREVPDQIGLAGVDELVDQCVDDGPDDLGLPPQQRACDLKAADTRLRCSQCFLPSIARIVGPMNRPMVES